MARLSRSTRTCVFAMAAVLCSFATETAGSAIPMWEFLTRDEKMSHLYRIFSKQVARYCSDSPLPDCNKNLLISGIRNLANADDNELDRMDPYQRGANDIIWHGIIGDNRLTKSKYGHEDSYYTTGADPLASSVSSDHHNGISEAESASINDYVRPSSGHGAGGPYLVGPMVIRVFPDGRPVPGDAQRPLPRDEDIDEIKYSRIPSTAEIEASGERFFYKKPTSYQASGAKRNIYLRGKMEQRPSHVIATTKNSQRYIASANPLFRERRFSEITNDHPRSIRFY